MLDPDQRQLYLEALKPPSGYALGEAIATTYALDLTTLLGVPIAFILPQLDARRLGKESAVALLEAIRRASGRLTVFCERSGIAAPSSQHVLYGLLERVIVEVQVPAGGSLHAKLWLMRFEPDPGVEGDAVMRLVVLSRNLTADRSWDVSLVLDGRATGRVRAMNRPLGDLIESLPRWAVTSMSEQAGVRAARLAEQVRRTEWELPPGFDGLRFHALGLTEKKKRWMPEESERLLVISPFVSEAALVALAGTTREAVAIIARGEELDNIAPEAMGLFGKALVLHGSAETEDGEDTLEDAGPPIARGLHAKVYIAKRGWDTHIYLGSANATSQALLAGMNVEFLAELSGKTSKVPGRGIDGVLHSDGLGALLVEYRRAEVLEVDSATEAAERALREAALQIASAKIVVRFERIESEYLPLLIGPGMLNLCDVASLRAWLVTTDPSAACDAMGLMQNGRAELARCAAASATGLVAFEIRAASAAVRQTFALNLVVEQMPADRDAHVVRMIVNNQDRFVAYLLALLEGLDRGALDELDPSMFETGIGSSGFGSGDGLLERLIRVRARDPQRLDELRVFVDALASTPEGRAIVPQDFLGVWSVVAGEPAP